MSLDIEKLKHSIKLQEGTVDHMYLDTRGYVTVGVGHLIADEKAVKKLDFIHRESHHPATDDQKVTEYNHVKEQDPGMVASRYKIYTELVLPEASIDRLLENHIEYFRNGLTQEIPDFETYPEPPQEGLLHMAFNLGLNGLFKKFPTFMKAAKARKWQICADECRRKGISQQRNDDTKRLFESCL